MPSAKLTENSPHKKFRLTSKFLNLFLQLSCFNSINRYGQIVENDFIKKWKFKLKTNNKSVNPFTRNWSQGKSALGIDPISIKF